jgi:hypothetical protein
MSLVIIAIGVIPFPTVRPLLALTLLCYVLLTEGVKT